MNNKQLLTSALLGLVLVIVGISSVFIASNTPAVRLGAGSDNTTIERFSDSTAVLVASTTSTLLLATSTARQYVHIRNASINDTIFLSLTGGPATRGYGLSIGPGQSFEIRDVNLYTGPIYAISSSSPATTTVAAKQ